MQAGGGAARGIPRRWPALVLASNTLYPNVAMLMTIKA
jgi:hypothetical protein